MLFKLFFKVCYLRIELRELIIFFINSNALETFCHLNCFVYSFRLPYIENNLEEFLLNNICSINLKDHTKYMKGMK